MPVINQSTVSIIPPSQPSGGSLKEKSAAFRYDSQKSPDAALWSTAADAFSNAQSQIDHIMNALRAPLPQPQVIQITDPSGVLIAQIGNMTGSNNVAYPGIWANNLYVGGKGPDTATLFSDGVEVAIGKNGQVFVLDPFGNVGAWLGAQSELPKNVTGAVNNGAGLIRLTVAAHGWLTGDETNVATVGGVPNATGQWIITVISANTFDLRGSTFAGTYTSGGTAQRFFAGGLFSTVAVGGSQAITNVANNGAGLARVTVPAHGYATGYAVVLTGTNGVPNINGKSWNVTVIDANNFDLIGSVFSGGYTGGGLSLNWPTAKLIARDDGSLTINGAAFTLNSGGVTTTISNAPGTVGPWTGQATSLISTDNATGALSEIDPFHIAIADSLGSPVVYMENTAGVGSFVVTSNPGAAGHGIFLDGGSPLLSIAAGGTTAHTGEMSPTQLEFFQAVGGNDTIFSQAGVSIVHSASSTTILLGSTVITDGTNTATVQPSSLTVTNGGSTVTISPTNINSPSYSIGGTPGIGASRQFGSSLTVNTSATGVFGTPGVGQSNGTVVTGVTLNLSAANVWTGGLLTA